ncbi:MAG: AsmA family protein [Acidobacteriota bacterium]|nr:AsmA family protein [Acidobacteriota bacterium]
MRIRYIIITLVLLVVVLAAVVGLLAANVNKYRPRVQAELQQKLNRQVTIGNLGLRVIPLSIRADNVSIADAPAFADPRPFATARALYISVGLFSLIGGNPEVKDLTLDQPQIELIHNASGVWNYSTIGSSGSSGGGNTGNSNSAISLNELKIQDGQVALTDQAANQPRSVYNHIDLKLTDYAPGKRFGIDVAVHFPGQGKQLLNFNGHAGPLQSGNSAATPIDGHLSLQEISLAAANRFSAGALPPQTDAVASGDADINSQAEQLSAKGNLKLQNAVMRGAKLDFPISARYDLSANRAQDSIQVRSGSVDLGSTSFTLAGTVDAHAKPANLNIQLTTKNSSITELAKLAGAFGVAFNPAYQIKGFITADVSAKGPVNAPQLNGSISAKQLEASGGEIKQPVSVPEIDLALSPDVVRSNNFTATSGATSVNSSFSLSQYATKNMNIDGTLQTNAANIEELLNMAKAYGMQSANGVSGTGKLSANIHVQGPLKNTSALNYSGTANISGATLTTPSLTKPVSIASANAQFSQNSIAITNLAASLGTTSVRGNLSAKNFAAPDVQFALSADKIDTAELQSLTAKQQPGQPASKPAAANKPAANTPSLIDTMTGSGTIAANTIKAQDIVLSNVRANCKLNRGIITLSPLTADIFGGKEAGALSLDVRPANPLCSVNAKFSGVDTNALLSAISSAKNTLYGSLAAATNLRFALVSSNDLPQTLNGNVTFDVTNGQLKNVNILNELSKVGKFLGSAPAQAGSGTALKKFDGTLNIVNGVASTNNLTAALDAGSLSANGTMNLVNQGLDLHMTAALASSTSKAVGGTQIGGFLNTALANNKGELVIPVLVTGTMAHPTFTPDAQALAQMKLKNLLPSVSDPSRLASGVLGGKGAGGILNGLLGGQAPAKPGQQAQPNQQQNQNPINSILNQFGKKKKP